MNSICERQQKIRNTLEAAGLWSHKAENLVLFTGMAESKYKHKKQIGGGPALSYWQVEPDTAKDHFKNYLKYRPELKKKIIKACDMEDIEFGLEDIPNLLHTNEKFAILMCRLVYYRVDSEIPTGIESLAEYWKTNYNTPRGDGRIKDFVREAGKTLDMMRGLKCD